MALKDADDLDLSQQDRGDDFEPTQEDPITDEEKKLAEELKTKEVAEAAAAEAAKKKKEEGGDEEDDETDPDKKKRRETRIPVSRHKQILEAQRVELEKALAKLSQYEGANDLAKTNDEIKTLEDKVLELDGKHAQLLTDGKPEDAAKLMSDIRKIERDIARKHTLLETSAAESRAYERARYDTTVERVEAAYPILNPDDDENFDPVKARKVLTVMKAYQIDGMTPSKALQEAVKDLLGDPVTKKQEIATTVTPKVDEAAVAKAAREEAARQKAADAAGKQPPKTDKTGVDSDKLGGGSLKAADVMKMPYKDFIKLDESVLSQMRGDRVE